MRACIIFLFIIIQFSCSEKMVGSYARVVPDKDANFRTELKLNLDHTFSYTVLADFGPLQSCDGIWKRTGKKISFHPIAKENDHLTKDTILSVSKKNSDNVKPSKKELLIFLVDRDTTLLIGGSVITKTDNFLIDSNNTILIDSNIEEVEISFINKRLLYRFDSLEKFNHYTLYIRFYTGKNYEVLEKIPFNMMTYKNGRFYLIDKLYFIKN